MSDLPLILTLILDTESQNYLNILRQKHFPPERNYLDAHLTLFHHLPAHEPQIISDIASSVQQCRTMQLNVTEIKSIGNGVAYKMECDELLQLHKYLQQQWAQWLIPQDKQKLWPHITIQNKVEANLARSLKEDLEQTFEPFTIKGIGLNLYEYAGGPWNFIQNFEFTG